jgi:hypothetical protein
MAATPITAPRAGSIRGQPRQAPAAGGARLQGRPRAVNATGFFGPATGAADEVVVGWFYETVDNSAGSPGDKLADIQYPTERTVKLLDNDTGAPVVVANRERLCSVYDDHTVTLFTPASVAAGFVYDVTSEGVWVEVDGSTGSVGAEGIPTFQSGTTTLISGTKTTGSR